MSVRFVEIPVHRVKPSPYNPRHEPAGLDDLAASIRSIGIIEPLVAVSKTDPECVELVCGSRRFGAAKLAGLKKVPCIILPAVGEQAERTISLVENLHRRELSHIEQGEAFTALMKTGLTQVQVAKQTGVSNYTVSVKLTLVNSLVLDAQELVHRDRMTLREALSMAKLPRDAQTRILAGGRATEHRPSKAMVHRRTKTEGALMAALQHYRDGNLDLALAESRRATGFLTNSVQGGGAE